MRIPAVAALLLALAAAPAARAQPVSEPSGPDTYLDFHLGAFVPQAGDLDPFDPGLAISGTFGARFSRHVGAEATVGWYHASASANGAEASLNAVPILASLRLTLPLDALELSARGGVGVHLTSFHGSSPAGGGYESATAFGYHFGAGAAVKLSPTMLVGVDVLATFASATYGGTTIATDGLLASVTLGYRL